MSDDLDRAEQRVEDLQKKCETAETQLEETTRWAPVALTLAYILTPTRNTHTRTHNAHTRTHKHLYTRTNCICVLDMHLTRSAREERLVKLYCVPSLRHQRFGLPRLRHFRIKSAKSRI